MKSTRSSEKTLSIREFYALFPTEEAAIAHFEKVIWNDIPICPHCGSANSYAIPKIREYRCSKCRKNYTVRHGTTFKGSPLPLKTWLDAMFFFLIECKSISSVLLSKYLGVTQKTAWYMLHRLRIICSNSATSGSKLSGIVEVDEAYIGGKEVNKHTNKKLRPGGGYGGKFIVVGLRERGGRVVAVVVRDTTARTLHKVIRDHVQEGSHLMTDSFKGYKGLEHHYKHSIVNHSKGEYGRGIVHTNSIESFWALLKRGFNGAQHHWSSQHLQKYLDEFTFRLNEASSEGVTIGCINVMITGSVGKHLAYKDLTSIEKPTPSKNTRGSERIIGDPALSKILHKLKNGRAHRQPKNKPSVAVLGRRRRMIPTKKSPKR